jgi:endonuclease/exonuclease/phosphatase family metal-dependent hydrolase
MKTAKLLLLISLFFRFEPSSAQTVKAITYNIRLSVVSDSLNYWGLRKEEMLDFLQKEQAEVIGLQEVLWEQLDFLAKGLKNYQAIGVGRDDGKKLGEFSPIFVDTVKLHILKQETFWLSTQAEIPSRGWDAALNRICTWALLEEKGSKKQLLVFNTHFDHIGQVARDSSAKLILRYVAKEAALNKLPVIVMGDFNSEPQEPAVVEFRKNLMDASEGYQDKNGLGTFNGFAKHSLNFKQIDFIFYERLTRASFQILRPIRKNGLQLSDHYPLKGVFEWRE